jgi:hypothetical protein
MDTFDELHTIEPYQLTCTRFNCKTYIENRRYAEKHSVSCIYGTPRVVRECIPEKTKIIIIELNVEGEYADIKGIGVVENTSYFRKHKIYTNTKYNMYSYVGIAHISISRFRKFTYYIEYTLDGEDHVWDIEGEDIYKAIKQQLLFGKGHSRRGYGITQYPIQKMNYIEEQIGIPACLRENQHLTLYKLIYMMLRGMTRGYSSYKFKERFKSE